MRAVTGHDVLCPGGDCRSAYVVVIHIVGYDTRHFARPLYPASAYPSRASLSPIRLNGFDDFLLNLRRQLLIWHPAAYRLK